MKHAFLVAASWAVASLAAAQTTAEMAAASVAASSAEGSSAPLRIAPEDITSFEGGRFVVTRTTGGECLIALQGTVTQSANARFDDVVRKAMGQGCARPLTLLLESPGGSVPAGIELGRSVHDEGMRTVARYTCASICSIIFVGGTERTLWGSRAAIGLHQPFALREDKKSCYTTNFDAPIVAMRRYLRFVLPQTADRVMEVVVATPCQSIDWVKGQRALELGLATRIEAEHEDVFGPRAARIPAAASAPR